MANTTKPITGGCLCGAIRYEARAEPQFAGYCCCSDCRRASGSGFVPFVSFAADALTFSGTSRQFAVNSFPGSDAVRNSCAKCGGLVFGGIAGKDTTHTIYAGSLDDPSVFKPSIAIFNRDRPDWVVLPPGLKVFETMPT